MTIKKFIVRGCEDVKLIYLHQSIDDRISAHEISFNGTTTQSRCLIKNKPDVESIIERLKLFYTGCELEEFDDISLLI